MSIRRATAKRRRLFALGACLAVLVPSAAGADGLPELVAAALREAPQALAPLEAEIRFESLTPVRGDVEAVTLVDYDPRTGRFEAIARNGGGERRIAGRAIVETPLPTPLRTIAPGEVITADMLGEIMTPVQRVSGEMMLEASELIGTEARRSLAVGRPVLKAAVGAPILVKRNSIVTLTFSSAHMRLSAKGRALEDGGAGEPIKAVNLDGSAVVVATVTAPDRLTVAQ